MKILKKFMVLTLTVAFLPGIPAKAAETQAKIEFTKAQTPVLTNITKWMPVGATGAEMHPMEADGVWGHSSDRKNVLGKGASYGVLLDIDDDFMYNLEEGQSVRLTIEYWDGIHPELPGDFDLETSDTFARIRAHYDANGTGDQISTDGAAITHLTPDFHIRNRNKWNSVSYILDDFKAGNGIMGSWDLEITDWGGSVNVARDVIYKSVRLEYYEEISDIPVELTDSINLGVAGNFEDIEKENFTLNIPMENISEDEIDVRWNFEIYDENNIFVDKFHYTCTLSAEEERTDSVSFKNPGLCGVYEIKAYATVKYPDGSSTCKYMGDENFSVAHISEQGEGNDLIGINVHTIGGGYGSAQPIADVLSMAGFGWVRESNVQNLSKNASGDWVATEKFMSDLEYIKDKELKVLMQLWGPVWKWENGTPGGSIPLNDADRQLFGEWCEDLATQVDGYVDAYEIFNEPGTTMFPAGYEGNKGEEYFKALKVAYEALKDVNKNIPVVGPVSATQLAVDAEFTEQFYTAGGLDYLDIHSTHRYPYTGTLYIKELMTSVGREQEETTIKAYAGGENPLSGMWLTEYGHNTENKLADGEDTGGVADPWDNSYWNSTFGLGYYDSIPRRTQARGLTLGYAMTHGFETSFDKVFVHNAIDFTDLTNSEHAWGVMNSYTGAEGYTPYSAKPSLVATAAFNHFIDDTSVVKGIVDEDVTGENEWNRKYAIWFDNSANSKFGDDVVYLQSEIVTESDMSLSLGCNSIDVYDLYGNMLGTMTSSVGVYKFRVTNEPLYIVGDFTKCSTPLLGGLVQAPTLDKYEVKDCAIGQNVTFTASQMETGDTIEVVGFETVSVDGSSVTIKVPNIYEGRAYGFVKIMNSAGNLRAALPVELWIPAPDLYVTTDETNLNIRGLAGLGGDNVSVLVTNGDNMPIGLAQERASESGVIDMSLDIPDADKELCNLKLYNGTVTINQQIIPDFRMSYTCKLNGEIVPLLAVDSSDFTDDDNFEITLNLTNNTGNSNPDITLYGACYDSDGKMVYFTCDSTDDTLWNGGNSEQLTITIKKKSADAIKLFVWDNNYKPIKEVTNID